MYWFWVLFLFRAVSGVINATAGVSDTRRLGKNAEAMKS